MEGGVCEGCEEVHVEGVCGGDAGSTCGCMGSVKLHMRTRERERRRREESSIRSSKE